MLKRLLAAIFLGAVALSATADTQVVCSVSTAAQTSCSAISVSEAAKLDPCACSDSSTSSTPASSLLTGLTHYWTLDEVSGTRSDSVSTLHLGDNNTVTSTTGKNSLAAQFLASNNEFLNGTLAVPATNTSFGVSAWIFPTNRGQAVLTQWNDTGTQHSFFVGVGVSSSADIIDLYMANAAGTLINVNDTVTLNAWHHVLVWYDSAGPTMYLRVDGGTTKQATLVGGRKTGVTAGFYVGRQENTARAFTGNVDEIGVWGRIFTLAEQTTLFNSGAGKFYPSF